MILALPIVLVAAAGTYFCWRLDTRTGLLFCALVLGYALATSSLSTAINAFGNGINNAIHQASTNSTKSGTTVPANYTPRSR
jgi:hypothetical protein